MPLIPIALGAFLRTLIMSVASGAVVTGAQQILDGTIRQLVFELRDTENITEQDAKDIIADILLDLAVNSASIMFILKTGVGVKTAEWLGLTSRNFGKAALSTAGAGAKSRLVSAGGRDLARRVLTMLPKIVPGPTKLFWLFVALTQVIEPAIYQPAQTERIWQALGFNVSIPRASGNLTPGPFSTDSSVTFNDFASSLETSGVKGINNPAALQTQIFSRTGLADLVNYVYGQEVAAGRSPSVKELIPKISQYLIMGSAPAQVPSPTASVPISSTIPRVYTGIVTQGVIGKGLEFTARPDDLIESVEELKQAAANNLAPFLQSLPSKIVYEVKIVPSIITREGFKQTGTVQQIKTGTTESGAPKYKTVVNKFATLNLYVLTDKGARSKIATVVLGPTNSAKLTVGINDLRIVEGELPGLVSTNDINEITGIETSKSVTVSTPPTTAAASPLVPTTAPVVTPARVVTTTQSVPNAPGQNALTLFEWYLVQGAELPPLSARANLYEARGLGKASYYTGTVEQNTKLLASLKEEALRQPTGNEPIPRGAKRINAEDDAPEGWNVDRINGLLYTWPRSTTSVRASSSSAKETTSKGEKGSGDSTKPKTSASAEAGAKTVVSTRVSASGDRTTRFSDGSETTVKKKK